MSNYDVRSQKYKDIRKLELEESEQFRTMASYNQFIIKSIKLYLKSPKI